jgi:hypothetical protein
MAITIDDIYKAYSTANTKFLIDNKEQIKNMFTYIINYNYFPIFLGDNHNSNELSEKFLYEQETAHFHFVQLQEMLMTYLSDDDDDHSKNFITSFKCIVENGIFNPDTLVDGELILANCISKFSGHKIQKEKLDFLFERTTSNVIKNYRDKNGWSCLLLLSWRNINIDDFSDYYCKLISTGLKINITETFCSKKVTFLNNVAQNGYYKFVKLAFMNEQDPNEYISSDFYRNMNTAQLLLYNHRFVKDKKDINNIINILLLLIAKGLDMKYTDKDGRNLMDYVYDFKWNSVLIGNGDYPVLRNNLESLLISLGCSKKTGNKLKLNCDYLPPGSTYLMKLLFDNRYEKDSAKLNMIFFNLKYMSQHGEDFSVVNHRYKTVYDEFCKEEGDPWFNTPISDYIKISDSITMIDEPKSGNLIEDSTKKRTRTDDQLIRENIVLKKKN